MSTLNFICLAVRVTGFFYLTFCIHVDGNDALTLVSGCHLVATRDLDQKNLNFAQRFWVGLNEVKLMDEK